MKICIKSPILKIWKDIFVLDKASRAKHIPFPRSFRSNVEDSNFVKHIDVGLNLLKTIV